MILLLDRQFIVEFSDYYNKSHRPIDDFGKPFFCWDEDEWSAFDNFMISCLQLYLEKGLVPYEYVNLEKKKLIDETTADFAEFSESFEVNKEYDKKELFESFKKEYEEIDPVVIGKLSQGKFTKWLKVWGRIKGYAADERKSGSKRTINVFE